MTHMESLLGSRMIHRFYYENGLILDDLGVPPFETFYDMCFFLGYNCYTMIDG